MTKLTGLKDTELLKKEKTAKVTIYVFIVILIVAVAFSIYDYLKSGFTNTTIMPVFALALLITNYGTFKSTQKEIESRNLK